MSLAGLAGTAALLLPRVALACAVCTAGRDPATQKAFLWTTLFMSALPLAFAGGVLLVVWHRVRARAAAALPQAVVPSRPAAERGGPGAASPRPGAGLLGTG